MLQAHKVIRETKAIKETGVIPVQQVPQGQLEHKANKVSKVKREQQDIMLIKLRKLMVLTVASLNGSRA